MRAKIERVRAVYFTEEWFGRVVPTVTDTLADWQITQQLGGSTIKPKGVMFLSFNPFASQPFCGMGLQVDVTDDQGQEQTFRLYVPFVQSDSE